jgi:hypothetical protein
MEIRDRIKELRRIPASELVANSKNWRRHPQWQRDGMQAVLENVGYAGALIAYESDGQLVLIDGHLRQEMTPTDEVPVLILDVNEDEANILLASYDPLTAMANEDGVALGQLLTEIESTNEGLSVLLQDINERYAEAAMLAVENPTNADFLPNETSSGADRKDGVTSEVPVDVQGRIYKAFMVHFPQDVYDALMENIFTLGDRWHLDTTAAVLQRAIQEQVSQE